MRYIVSICLLIIVFYSSAFAETATYGAVDLTGLARDSWPLNRPGEDNAMVCNVNGPDGFLTIRTAPTSNSPSARKLLRLAIVVVDTRQRHGHWVRVVSAHRNHTKQGKRQAFRELPVKGWAHDGYLCDFLD